MTFFSSPFALHKQNFPAVVGHRGFKGRFPENTLAAFDAGVSVGRADIIELDVQLASDNTVVVSHDPNTARCFGLPGLDITKTPYKGVLETLVSTGRLTSVYSSQAAAAATAAAQSPNQKAARSDGHEDSGRQTESGPTAAEREAFGLPTLYAAARRFVTDERYTKAKLMIDIKISNEPGIVQRVVAVLEQVLADAGATAAGDSFWQTHAVLGIWRLDVLDEALAGEAHGIPVCFIGVSRKLARTFMDRGASRAAPAGGSKEEVAGDQDESSRLLGPGQGQAQATRGPLVAISLHATALMSEAGARLLRDAQARGVRVYVWTVNRESDMRWAVAADLAGVITDFPDKFAAVRDEGSEGLKEPWEYVSWAEWNVTNVVRYYVIQALFFVIVYVKTGII